MWLYHRFYWIQAFFSNISDCRNTFNVSINSFFRKIIPCSKNQQSRCFCNLWLHISDSFNFFKQKTAYEMLRSLVGSEMCIRDSRIPLRYLPWSNFTAQLRYWQNYVGRPICFSMYGQQAIYIAPIPDQLYYIEVDTNILPTALSLNNPTQTDSIIDPWSTAVQYYAAYKAKFYEQSYGEAEIFKQEYNKHILNVLNSTFTRRIPDPYSSGG